MLGSGTSHCLVTGGAGFIGSHLAERLVALGHEVRVVDNLSTGNEANLADIADDIEFLRGDLCDADVCRRAVAGMDVVFHVAALPSVPRSLENPWASHAANVNATVRLLEACVEARVARIVYSSSSSVYGDTPVLPKMETAEPLPRSPYAGAAPLSPSSVTPACHHTPSSSSSIRSERPVLPRTLPAGAPSR